MWIYELTSWRPWHSRILRDHFAFADVPLPFPAKCPPSLRSCSRARQTLGRFCLSSALPGASYSDWMHQQNSSARIDERRAQSIYDGIAISHLYLWANHRPATAWSNDIHTISLNELYYSISIQRLADPSGTQAPYSPEILCSHHHKLHLIAAPLRRFLILMREFCFWFRSKCRICVIQLKWLTVTRFANGQMCIAQYWNGHRSWNF